MSKLLSQDEIDALLKGVQSGDIATSERESDDVVPSVKAFDFSYREIDILGRMPGLQRIAEDLVRLQRASLSSALMRFVKVSQKGISTARAGDLMGSVVPPATASIFTMEPLRGHACLVMDNPTVFALIECFFGSQAVRPPKQLRDLTAIEQRIYQKTVLLILGDLEKAWEDVKALRAEYVGSEYRVERLSLWSATEVVIRMEFKVQIEDFAGGFSFWIPYSMMSPLAGELALQVRADSIVRDGEWLDAMRQALLEVPVEVTAKIGGRQITLHEVLGLDIGTVIGLNLSPEDEIPVDVEGKTKFMGIPGKSVGNQAVRITSSV